MLRFCLSPKRQSAHGEIPISWSVCRWSTRGYRKNSLMRQYIAVFTGGTNPEFVLDPQPLVLQCLSSLESPKRYTISWKQTSISSVYPVYHQYIDILLWLRIKNDENSSLIRSNSGHFLETGYVLSAQFCLLIGGPIIIPIDIMGSSSSPFWCIPHTHIYIYIIFICMYTYIYIRMCFCIYIYIHILK